uniref:exodeoxyribonuclease III n=1 Tax=Xenopus tropicalis TaxID=8364 RepID=A0A803JMS9_XENTR
MAGTNLKLVSWNVRGMNDKVKRAIILDHLKKLKADIMLLQETHLVGQRVRSLNRSWLGPVFHAEYSTYSRGVAILFRKTTAPKIEKIISDRYGRYIILKITVYTKTIILANIYSPPPGDLTILQTILGKVAELGDHPVYWLGDFNAVPDPTLDRLRPLKGDSRALGEWLNTPIPT